MEELVKQIQEETKHLFFVDSSGHDMSHLKRVYNLAMHLQEKEGGDKIVIGVAALLHDIHRLMEHELGRFVHARDSLPNVKKILNKLDLTQEQIEKILHCVEYHDEYGFSEEGKQVDDIETLILQDADNLDAIGALGISRTFMFSGAHKLPSYVEEIPFDVKKYDESIRDPSAIHHFHSKLLKLKDNMSTNTAKELALHRHEFMVEFVNEFLAEWNGEK